MATKTLSPVQIYQYAYAAGFRGTDLIYAVAVAMLESGGNPQAYNAETAAGTKPGSGSRGLWQIYGAAHPEYNNAAVLDPMENARAAYKIYKEAGSRFTPWSTWNNGSAKQYAAGLKLSGVKNPAIINSQTTTQAVQQVTGKATPIEATGTAGGIESPGVVTNILNNARDAILGKTSKGEQRGGEDAIAFFGGVTLVLIGLVFLFVNSGAAQKTIETAGAVVAKVV